MMSKRLTTLFGALCAVLISTQASASIPTTADISIDPVTHEVTGTTGVIPQTATGQLGGTSSGPFIFTLLNAPVADRLIDGTLTIHARGDYTLNSDLETLSIALDDGTATELGALDSNGHNIENQDDLVEWTQSFILSGEDLFIWTQDNRIVITLNLSSAVDVDLYAGGQFSNFPPFVEATLTYTPLAVPLPTATWLFMSGLLGVLGLGRHKKVF